MISNGRTEETLIRPSTYKERTITKQIFSCSKSTIEAQEKGVKYIQS